MRLAVHAFVHKVNCGQFAPAGGLAVVEAVLHSFAFEGDFILFALGHSAQQIGYESVQSPARSTFDGIPGSGTMEPNSAPPPWNVNDVT